MLNRTDIERVASAAHELRPDWPIRSLCTWLQADHAHRAYADVAVALAVIATDPKTQTPKRMNESGPWWIAAQAAHGDSPSSTTYAGVPAPGTARCTVEGHEHELASNCRTCRSLEKGAEPTTAPTLRVGWTPHDAAWAAHLRDPENNPKPTTRDAAMRAANDREDD